MTVTIALAISRDVLLTSNMKPHWADKARKTRAIREMALILCRHEYHHVKLAAADLVVESRWTNRRIRDASSIAPMVKAAVDGFVEAGLLDDDNHTILRSEKYEIGEPVKDIPGIACWLKFTFTPVEPAPTDGGN